MLVNFSPKSRAVLDVSRSKAPELKHVNLHIPGGDYALQKDRSLFTVIRSPHIDKHSREQFERLVHKRLITFSTNNYSELMWFLDSLKLYEFTAVEINVKLTSNSYLLPTSTREQAKAQQPLLSSHMHRFKDYFPATSSSSSTAPAAAFSEALSGARTNVQTAAQEQRRTLQGSPKFQEWVQKLGPSHTLAPASASDGGDLASQVSRQLDQQLLGTPMVADDGQLQHKLLAAIHNGLKGLAQKLAVR
jgi:small subunit ribosomal protein S10